MGIDRRVAWVALLSALTMAARAQQGLTAEQRSIAAELAQVQSRTGALDKPAAHLMVLLRLRITELTKQDPRIAVQRGDIPVLLVVGDKDTHAAVAAALAQLRRVDLPAARLQCTHLTMPAALAQQYKLVEGVTALDEAAAAPLLKGAVQQRGTLVNLPEATMLPLQPFAFAPAVKPGQPVAADAPNVQVEGLRTSDDAIVLSVQPTTTLPPKIVPLQLGHGAALTTFEGNRATMLWIRFVAQEPTQPRDDTPAPRGK